MKKRNTVSDASIFVNFFVQIVMSTSLELNLHQTCTSDTKSVQTFGNVPFKVSHLTRTQHRMALRKDQHINIITKCK